METYSSTEVIGLPADAAGGLDARAGAGPTSPGTLGAVIGGIALIVVGTALGLGLGVGLHSDDKSLIYITTIASGKKQHDNYQEQLECAITGNAVRAVPMNERIDLSVPFRFDNDYKYIGVKHEHDDHHLVLRNNEHQQFFQQ